MDRERPVTKTNRQIANPSANRRDHGVQTFFRRSVRGRRALRLAASVFLRLLTNSRLRPFALLARFLAALRATPPKCP